MRSLRLKKSRQTRQLQPKRRARLRWKKLIRLIPWVVGRQEHVVGINRFPQHFAGCPLVCFSHPKLTPHATLWRVLHRGGVFLPHTLPGGKFLICTFLYFPTSRYLKSNLIARHSSYTLSLLIFLRRLR